MKDPSYSLLVKANLFISILLFILFLTFNSDYSAVSSALTLLAAISSAAILVLALYIVLFIFSFWRPKGLYIVAFVFVLAHLGIITDFFIYRLYHFHINAMVINILTSPAAADSIQLGLAPYLAIAAIIASLIAFEWYVIKAIGKKVTDDAKILNKRLNWLILLPLFLVIVIEKFSYGTAYLLGKSEITSKFSVVPLYQPLTFTRFAAKYFDFEPRAEAQTLVSSVKSLNYPLVPLELRENSDPVNIFIFASDAVRNSVLSPEVSPNISSFAQESWVYDNHYSGGNSTRFGIFSMMYGLNSTYWFSFLNATRGSLLFETLERQDYQINITSSTSTSWPEFRKTCYIDQQESIHDTFEGTPAEKDRQSNDALKAWLSRTNLNKPIFSFLFWDAPHQRSYPREYAKFQPDNEGATNYLTVSESDKEVLFNQYKNAVHYNDALFGEFVALLKEKGLYDDAIIILTSDHGQEFFEFGKFGHNSSFSRAQTQSPLIIKFPGKEPRTIDSLSSHVDIVPTLLSYIGVTNSPDEYSNGVDLLSSEPVHDYIFTANWNNNAIITDKTTMVFSNLPNKMFKNEIRSTETYKTIPKEKSTIDERLILDVLDQNRKFLR